MRRAVVYWGYCMRPVSYTHLDVYKRQPISYVCWLYVINTFPINIILLLRQRESYIPYFKRRWKVGLFGGLCSLGSYGVALWAMTLSLIHISRTVASGIWMQKSPSASSSIHEKRTHCSKMTASSRADISPFISSEGDVYKRQSLDRVPVPVWPVILSDRLPIVALVGRYPAN